MIEDFKERCVQSGGPDSFLQYLSVLNLHKQLINNDLMMIHDMFISENPFSSKNYKMPVPYFILSN